MLARILSKTPVIIDWKAIIDQIEQGPKGKLLRSGASVTKASRPSVLCPVAVVYPCIRCPGSVELCTELRRAVEVRQLQSIAIKQNIVRP